MQIEGVEVRVVAPLHQGFGVRLHPHPEIVVGRHHGRHTLALHPLHLGPASAMTLDPPRLHHVVVAL